MRPVIENLQPKQVLHGNVLSARAQCPSDHIDTLFRRCHFPQCGRVTTCGVGAPLQDGEPPMATRDRRLAEFDGAGSPPPGEPVQVLCEDQSGTYQLPFACYFADGQWRNHESGGALEATVVGWRLPRLQSAK
jgi:hypothetical protein